MVSQVARIAPATRPGLRPLLEELGDLKRVRSADREGSIAVRLFRSAWGELMDGIPASQVCLEVAAAALVATKLGDLDALVLARAGLPGQAITTVRRRAFDATADLIGEPLRSRLLGALAYGRTFHDERLPAFVGQLERQPRAGVTCPGKPRVVLEPPENHAEHCLLVAVYGVLLSPDYEADATTVFLAGLAHHLHNASLPDAGFTGETLLAEYLEFVMGATTAAALDELPQSLRARVVEARDILTDASTPEGRAFHAADVIDRVLQVKQHLRAASLTMDAVLNDMHLVHEGPVKEFHQEVLAGMDLG